MTAFQARHINTVGNQHRVLISGRHSGLQSHRGLGLEYLVLSGQSEEGNPNHWLHRIATKGAATGDPRSTSWDHISFFVSAAKPPPRDDFVNLWGIRKESGGQALKDKLSVVYSEKPEWATSPFRADWFLRRPAPRGPTGDCLLLMMALATGPISH